MLQGGDAEISLQGIATHRHSFFDLPGGANAFELDLWNSTRASKLTLQDSHLNKSTQAHTKGLHPLQMNCGQSTVLLEVIQHLLPVLTNMGALVHATDNGQLLANYLHNAGASGPH